jgi:hypothetical protein
MTVVILVIVVFVLVIGWDTSSCSG